MPVYQRELFKKLTNRLQLDPENQKYLNGGSLTGLIIHDRSNLWSFHMTLTSILPYRVFKDFLQHFHKAFEPLKIRIVIHVNQPNINPSLIQNYWPWIVKNCGLSSSMAQQLIQDGKLKVTDDDVFLNTKDEALKSFLINGVLIQIEDMYHQLGFPTFKINVPGSKSGRKLPAKLINFAIKKNANDIKLARSAAKALDKDALKK